MNILFNEERIETFFHKIEQRLNTEVTSITVVDSINVESIYNRYRLDFVELDFRNPILSDSSIWINGVVTPEMYPKTPFKVRAVRYSIPVVKGSSLLLRSSPNGRSIIPIYGHIESTRLLIDIRTQYQMEGILPDQVAMNVNYEYNAIVEQIKEALQYVNVDIQKFNSSLTQLIVAKIEKNRQEAEAKNRQNELLTKFNVK